MSFFNNTDKEEMEDKLKIGEEEFSQDELQELIGAGKKLKDIEKKNDQSIDDIVSSWGKRGNEIGKYKQQLEELESKIKEPDVPKTEAQLSAEEERKLVVEQAKQFGLLTRDEAMSLVEEIYTQKRNGEKMLSSVNKVIRQAKEKGQPETTPEKLLEFMSDPANPKDPAKAYKLMFEDDLDKWKEERLSKVKPNSMRTKETTPTAGAKQFTAPKLTRDNLDSVLHDFMQGLSQGE